MRRLWDKFKLPHFLIFETQEPVMVKPPDLINEGQWIDGGLYWMKSQEPPFSVSPSCPWRRVDAELPSRAESWHFIIFCISSFFLMFFLLSVFLFQKYYQFDWSFDPAAVAFGLKPFQIHSQAEGRPKVELDIILLPELVMHYIREVMQQRWWCLALRYFSSRIRIAILRSSLSIKFTSRDIWTQCHVGWSSN